MRLHFLPPSTHITRPVAAMNATGLVMCVLGGRKCKRITHITRPVAAMNAQHTTVVRQPNAWAISAKP